MQTRPLTLPLLIAAALVAPQAMAEQPSPMPAAAPAPTAAPVPAPASAVAPEPAAVAQPTVSHWYGGNILLADAAAVALLFVGAGTDSGIPLALAAGSFVVTPVILHAAHGNLGRGLISGGLRLGLPLTMGATFAKFASCGPDEWFCGLAEFAGGFLLGSAVAIAVDQSLARDKHPVSDMARGLVLAPMVQPARGGATAGLVGIF